MDWIDRATAKKQKCWCFLMADGELCSACFAEQRFEKLKKLFVPMSELKPKVKP